MWKSIQETRMFDSMQGPVPITIHGVRRNDGFTVTHEQQKDPEFGNFEIFLCKTPLEEFQFVARRYKAGRPTNTYEVLITIELTSDPQLCKKYSREIESALLNFSDRNPYHSSVRTVLFNIKGTLFKAEEL